MPSEGAAVEWPLMNVQDTGRKGGIAVQDAAAWVLRVGVIVSVATMLAGVVISFVHGGMSVDRMQHTRFDPGVTVLWHGLTTLRGVAVVQLGIYLLVLTPILRVCTSMVLFLFEEHDYLYALVTGLVLLLTLAGLLLLK